MHTAGAPQARARQLLSLLTMPAAVSESKSEPAPSLAIYGTSPFSSSTLQL